jgi:hypothetical protein
MAIFAPSMPNYKRSGETGIGRAAKTQKVITNFLKNAQCCAMFIDKNIRIYENRCRKIPSLYVQKG